MFFREGFSFAHIKQFFMPFEVYAIPCGVSKQGEKG
jgi:hypothetical protein